MRRWSVRLGLGLVALVLLAGAGAVWLAFASLPQVTGELALPGLKAPLTIVRDASAIPHVEAADENDAYFALGFLHGQDRLWQMELDRLAGQGRLAEVLGETALPIDRFMRTLGLAARAQEAMAGIDPVTMASLESYAAGVNAAIARYGFALPPEFLLLRHRPEPWRPVDSMRFAKLMALDLSSNWREELLRARLAANLRPDQLHDIWPDQPAPGPITMAALADLPLDRLAALLPAPPPPGIGSNIWVVDGHHTASGKPLLANDPHLSLQMPGHWYLAHLEAPGLSVIGATLPGLPFVVLGRNRELAWGFTNTGSDTQDLFVEQLDPADANRYLTPTGSEPFQFRDETISVRAGQPIHLRVRETRHGPVLSDLVPAISGVAGPGHVLALAWTQLTEAEPDTTLAAGFALGKATNADSFMAAAELYRGAQQNMAFAVRDGTIGMVSPGLVPIRKHGDGRMPVPGWTGEYDWRGTIRAAELPRRIAPADGVLINANNRLVDDSYPYLLTATWEPPYRAERIASLLGDATDLDVERFTSTQLDIRSRLATDFLPFLPPKDTVAPGSREPLAALASWDGVARADRPEPLLFAAWYRELGTELAGDELGPALVELGSSRAGFLHRILTERPAWCDRQDTPAIEDCAEARSAAFEAALAALEQLYGPDWRDWRWGDAHLAVLAHRPFEDQPQLRSWFGRLVPVGGDGTTVNVAASGTTRAELPFGVVHAAGYRAVYDLARPDASRWIAATGQSGHPLSPHFVDQTMLWRDGTYLPMSMAADGDRAHALGTLRIAPEPPP